ncbi:TPA: hypothetical protein ACXPW6_003938 [Klebsiella variicola subsp. variicola]|nr:hypothetical protein [Klebsiella quasipneumoniae subsp. similipneumoniae]HBS2796113.1 hypothetical protein [Klebsiella quasipneumoniae subsp. similipneumoniae]HBS2812506.1 hypothetical protein [Klebsiella quasipneumoniae subsp. similipneumoniae]HCM6613360.1 hypothetical protein [Klebsiella quasipneumoniae]
MKNEIEQIAQQNDMSIEFVTWFFNEKKLGCGNVWFIMMAAMWEGWKGRSIEMDKLAAENVAMRETIEAVRGVADNSSGIAGWHLNGEIAQWSEILPEIDDIETPATDRIVAGIKADGVEEFAKALDGAADVFGKSKALEAQENFLYFAGRGFAFAKQLREVAKHD